ncbi:ABC transporter substrate-binding protein [Halosimplex pelagicum]|uniref:ABC transporter substrate-binding protein n=1 Tax=Halosimplex pelagicum TaxID=869886 RepID=A0A7D5TGL2_9EURY|nr:ABC transporter substrate-binding protein [Halosimplex pelagicum]QLH81736.1 ABC transporter substrate-binding protein [Halosimplex pelagicum]
MPTRDEGTDDPDDASIDGRNGSTTRDRSADGPRRGRSRRRFIGTALAGAGAALSGCSGVLGGGSSTSLTIGYQPFGTPYWSELVVKHGELIEKYTDELSGSYEVSWQSALQGSIIGNRMISGENQAGYNGDMPTILALANDDRPINMVGLSGWSMGQQCNVVITPKDSDIEGPADLDGADVGATTGACSHRFLLSLQEYEDISVNLVDQDVNTILANVGTGDLDAGVMWEPNPTMGVVQQDVARWVVTGAPYDDPDIGALTMNQSLIDEDYEAAKAIMKAELEAKHVMKTDEEQTLDLIKEEEDLADYERATVEAALFENISVNPDTPKMHFATDLRQIEPARTLLEETAPQFLLDQGSIEQLPGEERFHFDLLDEAASELAESVDWDPRDEEVSAP